MATTTKIEDPTDTIPSTIVTSGPCVTDTPAIEPQFTPTDAAPDEPEPSLKPSLSFKSVRSTLSMSEKTSAQLGWVVAFLSVLLTIVALSPAFRSQNMSERALKLAEWTALKDFIEECREESAVGIQSQACVKALNLEIPPPPYVKAGVLEKMRRDLWKSKLGNNGTLRAVQQAQHGRADVLRPVQGLACLVIVFTACMFYFLGSTSSRARMSYRSIPNHDSEKKQEDTDHPSYDSLLSKDSAATSTIRYPPFSTTMNARQRIVRTHPIYNHSSLESAIHHEDYAEIRLRFRKGEDVNQHWPYLIYKLAITPKSAITTKQLEIARLCLDWGADVNVVKGWNGQSALMIAIHFGNVAIAKLLMANGALVCYSPPDSNLTALHRCVRLAVTGSAPDALEIMKCLFQYGASANQADRLGETALHKLLIDSWFRRHDEDAMRKLRPVALCLVQHGACKPRTIKEKYILCNPLWDIVHRAMEETKRPGKCNRRIV